MITKIRSRMKQKTSDGFAFQSDGSAIWCSGQKLLTFVLNENKPVAQDIEFKTVIDETDASAGQHHVWLVLQLMSDFTIKPVDEIFPLLVYERKESTANYNANHVGSLVNKPRSLHGTVFTRQDGTKHTISFVFSPDLKSTWDLLGIPVHGEDAELRSFCLAVRGHLSTKAAPLSEFPNAIINNISDVEAMFAFCFLHAWLRLGSQRLNELYARTKKLNKNGKSF